MRGLAETWQEQSLLCFPMRGSRLFQQRPAIFRPSWYFLLMGPESSSMEEGEYPMGVFFSKPSIYYSMEVTSLKLPLFGSLALTCQYAAGVVLFLIGINVIVIGRLAISIILVGISVMIVGAVLAILRHSEGRTGSSS
jgi:hypothetical protein